MLLVSASLPPHSARQPPFTCNHASACSIFPASISFVNLHFHTFTFIELRRNHPTTNRNHQPQPSNHNHRKHPTSRLQPSNCSNSYSTRLDTPDRDSTSATLHRHRRTPSMHHTRTASTAPSSLRDQLQSSTSMDLRLPPSFEDLPVVID